MIKKYIRVWWILTKAAAQISLQSRFGSGIFLLGKLLRFGLFLVFLFLLLQRTETIGGYSVWQIIFFYATFNIVDSLSQFLLREVYRFRVYVQKGFFDYIATYPISPLFRSLLGGCDVLDIPLILASVVFVLIAAGNIGIVTFGGVILYVLLLLNALLLAVAFHIAVLAVAILTTEVDNAIMLYRDVVQMGRVPVDIYAQPIRALITFAIPVGVMMTYPAQALMGLLSWYGVFIAGILGVGFFYLSLRFWQYALNNYTSVSS